MIYMIFEISCSIFKKKQKKNFFFSIFTFLKRSFLGILDFWLKTSQNYMSCSKNSQNHQFALLSFTFLFKKKTIFWRWPFFSDLWHGIAHTMTCFYLKVQMKSIKDFKCGWIIPNVDIKKLEIPIFLVR